MAAKSRSTKFDTSAIEKMTEPISIRITRQDRTTGRQIPLVLPQLEWGKSDARRIESIVLNDVGGGGVYEGEMTGANGVGFTWSFTFPESQFPPKLPETMRQATQPDPQSAPPGTVWTPPYGGVPTPPQPYAQPPQPQPYSSPRTPPAGGGFGQAGYGQMPYAGYQPQQPYPPYMPTPFPQTPPSSKEEALRAEVEAMKRSTMEAEFRREREQADARHAAEMAELRRAIEQQNSKKPDAELEMLKLQMQQQQQQWEREREQQRLAEERRREEERQRREEERRREDDRRREAEARRLAEERRRDEEARRREDQAQRERQHQQQLEEARRREEAAQREASERRWEMVIQQQAQQQQMMQQSITNNPMNTMLAELQRQLADAQRTASERANAAPMQSLEMARMFKEMSGSDQLMKNINEAYSSAHGIGMRSLEMMNQMMMSQQGSPGWEILSQTIEGAKSTITDYVTASKRAEGKRAAVEQAQAHERMMAHQAAAAQAQADALARQAANDPSMRQAAEQARREAEDVRKEHSEAIQAAAQAHDAAIDAEEKREDREHKLFGPAYDEVQALRQFVMHDETPPDQARAAIVAGVNAAAVQIEQNGVQEKVPAFMLFYEGRTAELVELLIPNRSGEFIGECAREIERLKAKVEAQGTAAITAYQEEMGLIATEGGDDDDEDEDDEDEDDE